MPAKLVATPGRILRNIRFQAAAQGYGALVNLLLPILIVRLGVARVGVYQVGMVLWVIFRVFADLGVGSLCIRDVARHPERLLSYQRAQMVVRLCSSAVCLGTMFLFGIAGYEAETRRVVVLFGLAMFLEAMAEGHRWAFRAKQAMGRDAVAATIERTSTLAFTAVGVFGFGTVTACAAAVAAGQAMNLAAAWLLSRPLLRGSLGEKNPALVRYLYRTGPSFMMMAATWILYSRIDYLILDKWPSVSDVEVGLYALAYLPLKGILMVPEVVMMALFPALAETSVKNIKRLRGDVSTAFNYLVGGTMGVALISVVLRRPISRILLILHQAGEETAPLGRLLAILILAAPLYTITSISGHVMAATGHQIRLTMLYLLALTFNVLGNTLYAIPAYGAMGCAILTVLTEAILSTALLLAMPGRLWRLLAIRALAAETLALSAATFFFFG